MIEFGIVGVGWRAAFFARIALACPGRFRLVGAVARRSEAGAAFARSFGVATLDSIGALLAKERPQFVVTSYSRCTRPASRGVADGRGAHDCVCGLWRQSRRIDRSIELGGPVASESRAWVER